MTHLQAKTVSNIKGFETIFLFTPLGWNLRNSFHVMESGPVKNWDMPDEFCGLDVNKCTTYSKHNSWTVANRRNATYSHANHDSPTFVDFGCLHFQLKVVMSTYSPR